MEKIIDFSSDFLLTYGRTAIKETSLLLGWPGSGFCFAFTGTEFRIKFGKFDSDRHFYFKISVDKISQTHCVCATDQIIILRGLSNALHQVKVTRITESINLTEVSQVTICGDDISFSRNVSFPTLKFEFIGDSLTAGFGNMSEPDAGIYRASEQDLTFGYTYLTATGLKADGRYICCSGKGIFNNWDGSKENRIPDFYTKQFIGSDEDHDFSSWRPNIIFINAGTNDITAQTDPNDFKKAYIDFIEKVHKLNPQSRLVCIHGMTTDKFEETFEEIESTLKDSNSDRDLRIEFIKFKPITKEFCGALGHPNSKAHSRFARDLIKTIKRILPR